MKKTSLIIILMISIFVTGCGNLYSSATPTTHEVIHIGGDCR